MSTIGTFIVLYVALTFSLSLICLLTVCALGILSELEKKRAQKRLRALQAQRYYQT